MLDKNACLSSVHSSTNTLKIERNRSTQKNNFSSSKKPIELLIDANLNGKAHRNGLTLDIVHLPLSESHFG